MTDLAGEVDVLGGGAGDRRLRRLAMRPIVAGMSRLPELGRRRGGWRCWRRCRRAGGTDAAALPRRGVTRPDRVDRAGSATLSATASRLRRRSSARSGSAARRSLDGDDGGLAGCSGKARRTSASAFSAGSVWAVSARSLGLADAKRERGIRERGEERCPTALRAISGRAGDAVDERRPEAAGAVGASVRQEAGSGRGRCAGRAGAASRAGR